MFRIPAVVKINSYCAALCSATYLGFHTLYVPIWKHFYVAKENEFEEPMPESISNLVDTVMNDVKLSDAEKRKVKPFVLKSQDIKHIGNVSLITGVSIGIPKLFMLDDKTDLELKLKTDKKAELPSGSEELLAIKNALLLSEDAKKFAIAQVIFKTKHFSFYWITFLPLLLVSGINVMYFIALKKQTPRFQKFQFIFQLQTIILAIWMYSIIYNVAGLYQDCWADLQAAKLGNRYLLGGIEFYEKLIERNKGFKKWTPKAPYTDDGDYSPSAISIPKMSLPLRITYLNELKHAISGKQQEPSIWSYVFYTK